MSCHADSIIEHPYLDDVLAGYTLPASHNEPHFGSAIAFGKWNGDEHIDMAVGEIGATNKAGRTHTVWIFLGPLDAPGLVPALGIEGDGNTDQFGYSLKFVQDLNGDGLDELVVGAPNWPNQVVTDAQGTIIEVLDRRGRVDVFFGEADGSYTIGEVRSILACPPNLRFEGPVQGGRFGESLAAVADFDNDGQWGELVIGAPGSPDSAPSYPGRAYFVFGAGLVQEINVPGYDWGPCEPVGMSLPGWDFFIAGQAGRDRFGTSLAVAGDLHGESGSEVIIGAPQFFEEGILPEWIEDHWPFSTGPGYARAYTYDSSGQVAQLVVKSGSSQLPSLTAVPGQYDSDPQLGGEAFGYSVAAGVDLDFDGVGEILVGCPLYDLPQAAGGRMREIGRVRVFSGATFQELFTEPAAPLDPLLVGQESYEEHGFRVGFYAPDAVDGVSDILASSWLYSEDTTFTDPGDQCAPDYPGLPSSSPGGIKAGYGFIRSGAIAGQGPILKSILGQHARDRLGYVFASPGDLDGDGRPELFVSSFAWALPRGAFSLAGVQPYQEQGRLYFFRGSTLFDSP